MLTKCERCGKEYEPVKGWQKYCSAKCRSDAGNERFKARCPEKECVRCGKKYRGLPESKYCSMECYMEARSEAAMQTMRGDL